MSNTNLTGEVEHFERMNNEIDLSAADGHRVCGNRPEAVDCTAAHHRSTGQSTIQASPNDYHNGGDGGGNVHTRSLYGIGRGGYRIHSRGGRPVMDWCLNGIEVLSSSNGAAPFQGWAPVPAPTTWIRA